MTCETCHGPGVFARICGAGIVATSIAGLAAAHFGQSFGLSEQAACAVAGMIIGGIIEWKVN